MMKKILIATALMLSACAAPAAAPPLKPSRASVRIGATQPRARLIDPRLASPGEVLAKVEETLGELEGFVRRAGEARCDIVVLPEDTLGLGRWEAAHPDLARTLLPRAVARMLERLGAAAARQGIYLICCNDTVEPDGSEVNASFLLGRDGREIGRYHKVNMPIHELHKKRGIGFPVFPTPDLGTLGMLICYDMVFPEAARCLALAGADILFHPTLGGAAIGDGEISRCAFRTRAVENFVYIVVAQRGSGTMVISPKGEILAEGKGPDDLVVVDINPGGHRDGGDAMNRQEDMRARLFRERSPEAYAMLTNPSPPVLAKVPETISVEESVRIARGALTDGDARFKEADRLRAEGRKDEAIRAYEALIRDYPHTWIDRVSRERLTKLRS